jgi:hypothetical protein
VDAHQVLQRILALHADTQQGPAAEQSA